MKVLGLWWRQGLGWEGEEELHGWASSEGQDRSALPEPVRLQREGLTMGNQDSLTPVMCQALCWGEGSAWVRVTSTVAL